MESTISGISTELGSLSGEVDGIKTTTTNQDTSIDNLSQEQTSINTEITGIKTTNTNQDTSIDNLSQEQTSINTEITGIKSTNNGLATSIGVLNTNVDTINNKIVLHDEFWINDEDIDLTPLERCFPKVSSGSGSIEFNVNVSTQLKNNVNYIVRLDLYRNNGNNNSKVAVNWDAIPTSDR